MEEIEMSACHEPSSNRRARRWVDLWATGLVVAACITPGEAAAATGDLLLSFDASAAGVPKCVSGFTATGVAFDGHDLILSCTGDDTLHRVDPVSLTYNGATTIGGLPSTGLGALAWDAGRQRLWACNAPNTVVLIDLDSAATDAFGPLSLTTMPVEGCVDGLAYDASDDTLWTSEDVAGLVQHYDLSGGLIAEFQFSNVITAGPYGNAGIAVGASDLFLGELSGVNTIWQVPSDFSGSTAFISGQGRTEDLECDDHTFASLGGVSALWSLTPVGGPGGGSPYDRNLRAWELPGGVCPYGGGVACDHDGMVDAIEECDDGNTTPNDGCTECKIDSCHTCTGEPSSCSVVADGTTCDDGNLCTGADECQAGSCAGVPTVDACALAGKSKLVLKDNPVDATKRKLIWKWAKGETTPKAAFGDPLGTTRYELCIYDGAPNLLSRTVIPPGGFCNALNPRPCWKERQTGFRYADKDGASDGVRKAVLKEGLTPGKAKTLVKAAGPSADLPALPIPEPAAFPMTVQLKNGAGQCWQAEYPSSRRNTGTLLKAISVAP
jgi:hypothetical protein